MDDKPPISRRLKIFTIVSGVAFVVPTLAFVATHDLTPANEPGGFGAGYDNMIDGFLYSLIIVPALFCFLEGGLRWRKAARGNK